jgi:hypothetical protein
MNITTKRLIGGFAGLACFGVLVGTAYMFGPAGLILFILAGFFFVIGAAVVS